MFLIFLTDKYQVHITKTGKNNWQVKNLEFVIKCSLLSISLVPTRDTWRPFETFAWESRPQSSSTGAGASSWVPGALSSFICTQSVALRSTAFVGCCTACMQLRMYRTRRRRILHFPDADAQTGRISRTFLTRQATLLEPSVTGARASHLDNGNNGIQCKKMGCSAKKTFLAP